MRTIPPGFDLGALARIDAGVNAIKFEHVVSLPLVVESGSRAWGFPSPDSDYDVRFLYVRPAVHYLSPWLPRDVIETPIVGDLDINGWDLGKALKLLLKGNAVIVEWLTSPIIYEADPAFREEFLTLAEAVVDRNRVARHYLHLGEGQMSRSFGDGRAVAQKRIFYAMRPAAALRWLRLRPEAAVAPMHFPTLLAECDAPADVRQIAADLMARKAQTRELGTAPLPSEIAAFIEGEFDLARRVFEGGTSPITCPRHRRELEAFLRATVQRLGPVV